MVPYYRMKEEGAEVSGWGPAGRPVLHLEARAIQSTVDGSRADAVNRRRFDAVVVRAGTRRT